MKTRDQLIQDFYSVNSSNFEVQSLEVFDYQLANNKFYKEYVELLKGVNFKPRNIEEIPFLPIQFFKSQTIKSGVWTEEKIYKSSATTGMTQSQHYVLDDQLYLDFATKTFEKFYGDLKDYVVLALLPGYLDRGNSSLITMCQHFIDKSQSPYSGFYLNEYENLFQTIEILKPTKKILLLGVSFALWELSELEIDLNGVIVMETGGMKGKGPELPKNAFHNILKAKFKVSEIHSEYGMTELLSQGYSLGKTIFQTADTMKVLISDVTDPLSWVENGKSGVINVVDLINIDSCSFVQTEDLGLLFSDGSFQVQGRVDAAEIRGCNLLVSDISS